MKFSKLLANYEEAMRKSKFISQLGAFYVAVVALSSFVELCVFLYRNIAGESDLAMDTVEQLVWAAAFKFTIFSVFAIRFGLISRYNSTKPSFIHASWLMSAIVSLIYVTEPLMLWQCYVERPSICFTFYDMSPRDQLEAAGMNFLVLSAARFVCTVLYAVVIFGKQRSASASDGEG